MEWKLVFIIAFLILVATVVISWCWSWHLTGKKIEKEVEEARKKEYEKVGIVSEVIVMTYMPGGFGSFNRPEQTLVIFRDKFRIRIEGLHPEIKKDEKWKIRYKKIDERTGLNPLIEKGLIQQK